ncbi:MAG: 16S rRNA (guanine(527)-N(7))-methyltransferase RsmG [Firmicutes bacterium]|nr:16S rRNA (guanine(527)-N(7))-methyltransferase RsmG [Bacillota bacterium]
MIRLSGKSAQGLVDKIIDSLQLECSLQMREQLSGYAQLLLEGLKKQRLSGERTLEGIVLKQIYDSLFPLTIIGSTKNSRILDLGTGGGLPGIPLKILLPESDFYLMDSNKRKMDFLIEVTTALGLKKISCLHGRAENWGHDINHREKYDYVFSKAVAEIAVLAELALPFIKIGGTALFYKGPRWKVEAEKAVKAIEFCGGTPDEPWHYKILTGEERVIFRIRKIEITPDQYPRSVGKPAKRPIGS